jgi:hypothetical protein
MFMDCLAVQQVADNGAQHHAGHRRLSNAGAYRVHRFGHARMMPKDAEKPDEGTPAAQKRRRVRMGCKHKDILAIAAFLVLVLGAWMMF